MQHGGRKNKKTFRTFATNYIPDHYRKQKFIFTIQKHSAD